MQNIGRSAVKRQLQSGGGSSSCKFAYEKAWLRQQKEHSGGVVLLCRQAATAAPQFHA
jgi:hypothetical protein